MFTVVNIVTSVLLQLRRDGCQSVCLITYPCYVSAMKTLLNMFLHVYNHLRMTGFILRAYFRTCYLFKKPAVSTISNSCCPPPVYSFEKHLIYLPSGSCLPCGSQQFKTEPFKNNPASWDQTWLPTLSRWVHLNNNNATWLTSCHLDFLFFPPSQSVAKPKGLTVEFVVSLANQLKITFLQALNWQQRGCSIHSIPFVRPVHSPHDGPHSDPPC